MASRKKSDSSTLTPQRKHRKLLKDGSGTEVWPESIEAIFVQGLRDYWNSPYPTYSQPRGRSRWRNQFLVDYLQRAGINRSKKQVASHIQVLRNMWKGEPHFHLVAAGDDSSPDATLNSLKLDDQSLLPLDFDDLDSSPSPSTSPDFSPPEFQVDLSPSPTHIFNNDSHLIIPHSKLSSDMSSHSTPNSILSTSVPTSMSIYPLDIPSHQSHDSLLLQTYHYPLECSSPPLSPLGPPPQEHDITVRYSNPEFSYPTHRRNHSTAFSLFADGMTPFSVNLYALSSSHQPPPSALTLKIRLSIPSVDHPHNPSLHGFSGNISLSRLWISSGKCTTRTYSNTICISEETGPLEISSIDFGVANAVLPESTLSRCRWLDKSIQTTLTQEITVDDQTLLYIIYHLDSSGSVMPSAELLGYQNRKAILAESSQNNYSAAPYSIVPRHSIQTSLSNARAPASWIPSYITTTC